MKSKNEVQAVKKGYFVNKSGVAINANTGRTVGTRGKKDYKYIGFRGDNGKVLKVYIHRLQAYQKYGEKIYDSDIVVRHLNGNSLDNSCDNIEIGTASDNMMDVPSCIRVKKSSNAAKIYPDNVVVEIRNMRKNGKSYKEIMEKFNISSKGTLSHIINKRIV